MAAITIQEVPEAGLANATFAAANGGGDTVAAKTKRLGGYDLETTLLLVRNTDAATRDVTVGSLAAVTVPATTGFAVIPIPDEGINDASVAVSYSAVANLTVAAVRIGRSY
jgi:hypothetical protein